MTSIERAWHRAITQLEKTQSARIIQEDAARKQAETEIAALIERRNQEMHDYLMAPMPSAPPIGFVSQSGRCPALSTESHATASGANS
jgi:hypothetical protein